MKILQSIEEIFSQENIASAIEFLNTKKNSCGNDGVWLYDLAEYWTLNGEKILDSIKNKTYEPQIAHEKVIIRPNGKHRKISLLASIDRLLLRTIQQNIQVALESQFSQHSFAYQTGKGIVEAVQCAAAYIQMGKSYVLEVDIKDFFDTINHEILLSALKQQIQDPRLYHLLESYIKCRMESGFQIFQKNCGILQGSPLSPSFSNLYLHEFDCWMEQQGYSFIRFSDDINVYVSDLQEGEKILGEIRTKLQEYKLEINEQKLGIYLAIERRCLGYCFEKRKKQILVKKFQKKQTSMYKNWHTSALEKIGHTYHVVNNGVLSKQDYTLLFENEEKKIYIPVETTNAINIYSNVDLSSNVLSILNQRSLNLNIFDKYGVYQGSFYSAKQRNRMKCLMGQVGIYQDEKKRLEYAKKIDMASLHNLRCNLKYYQKRKPSPKLQKYIQEISTDIKAMNESVSVDALLLIEARARQKYYQGLNEMIAEPQFHFTCRTKRPPKDEINALISFGNVYLYQKISQIIHETGLDIRVSFVHSALKRYENLNLDIADIFKPIIVDRVIFRVINKKMLSVEDHFSKENEGVFLNAEGKRIFLKELEWKMKQVITVRGEQYTYERLLHREIRNLEQSILGNSVYKAFKYEV